NTIDCGGVGAGIVSQMGNADSIFAFNNIIYNPMRDAEYHLGVGFKNEGMTVSHVYEDYNMFYGRADHLYYAWGWGTAYTKAQWTALNIPTFYSGYAVNDVEANPLFVNYAAHNYALQAGSPALTGGRGGVWPTYRGAKAPFDMTVTLSANPTSLPVGGGSTTLTWTSTNADSVVVRDQNNTRIVGSGPTNSSAGVSLTSSTTYTATAYKSPNTTTAQATVTVAISSSTDIVAPSAVTSLIITRDSTLDPTHRNITLRWTAPGDDADTGPATTYDLRFDTLLLTNDTRFNAATQVTGEPSPQPAGGVDSITITNLNPSQVYFFALKTADEVPNWSPMSNVAGSQNRALGRVATVSGSYPGYAVTPLTNGLLAPRGGTTTTWSSDQNTQPHWVEVDFGAVRPINCVQACWAWNSGQSAWMVSQQYTIQRWDGSAFVDVATVTNPPTSDSVAVTVFPKVSTQRARIYQPASMGPAVYPTIMWLTELKMEYDTIPPPKINDLTALP
ncbi:MAG: discoidin domain-containing protein, partial [candidate division Zixibacteria bacterium]|nr:discoidin domain-containing protein [candidate division Zixibacteria bacterium]